MRDREEMIRIGQQQVKITRPDKVLFPNDRITKRELIEYYRRIAGWILPQIRERPLTLERYPDGIGSTRIIQKSAARYFPKWINTVAVAKIGGRVRQVLCDDEATLAYLANLACITPHISLSRVDKMNYPDQMVLDLDPSGSSFAPVVETAKAARRVLEEIGLHVFVKTTGSRGLHVIVPLKRQEQFDAVRAFAREVAEILVQQDPKHRTLEQRKNNRGERVFIDINRNAYAQTVASAYAVRARPGAPVSVPVEWRELESKDLRPDGVTVRNIFERIERVRDPWKDMRQHALNLARPAENLRRFRERALR